MENTKEEIPYGHVRIHCNVCGETYFATAKELRHRATENCGHFPCTKCGSHATQWDFRKAE